MSGAWLAASGWRGSGPGFRQFFEQREKKGNKKPGAVAGLVGGGGRHRRRSKA
jgi:hypothetical protein